LAGGFVFSLQRANDLSLIQKKILSIRFYIRFF
jgi:hypothetical protein